MIVTVCIRQVWVREIQEIGEASFKDAPLQEGDMPIKNIRRNSIAKCESK